MRLGELLRDMRGVETTDSRDPVVSMVSADSREIAPGALFASLAGCDGKGKEHIEQALEKGAAALLLPCMPSLSLPVPCVVAEDVRKALGEAADGFYDHPSRSLDLIGVTGTNGKTTTAYLLRHLFNRFGRRTGMLGTIEYDLGNRLEPAPLTTPDAVRFTRSLAEMRDFGCRAAVVEVSSHALDQDRVWPHRFACAVFTNLTRDHLDYHGDMESYFEAKRLLFSRLDDKAAAVFNYRDPAGLRMAEGVSAKRLGYVLQGTGQDAAGLPADAHRVEITASDLGGQSFTVSGPKLDREFRTPLVGRHNVENCAGAVLAGAAMGIPEHTIAEAMADFPGVPGRLERVESFTGATAFVDYAHTDDALRSVLSVLRPLAKGKLITVFGCGGDRDGGKRPLMAKAAEEYSDLIVVTSDNPRTEDPQRIIDDIMRGFSSRDKVGVDADRAGAVRLAVSKAGSGDVVLVAGKGHEDYQIVGTEKRHLDDRELVRDAFAASRRGSMQ